MKKKKKNKHIIIIAMLSKKDREICFFCIAFEPVFKEIIFCHTFGSVQNCPLHRNLIVCMSG